MKLLQIISSLLLLTNANSNEPVDTSQIFNQGYEINEINLMQGYNAPARN